MIYSYKCSFYVWDIKFNKSTLILLGRQDSSVGYKDAWSILDNYPKATFAVLDKAGGDMSSPKPLEDTIRRFDELLEMLEKEI